MRIKSITMENYRQYLNASIKFEREQGKKDLHVIFGIMGTGKTNFLNAVNWCLYKEEPYLSSSRNSTLPVNAIALENASVDSEIPVTVSLLIETADGEWAIRRKVKFRKTDENSAIEVSNTFSVEDENGTMYSDESAIFMVEKFVPRSIKQFFFVDGERLDRYLSDINENVKESVFEMAQLHILDVMEEKLRNLLEDYERRASKKGDKLEDLQKQIEELRDRKTDAEKRLEEEKRRAKQADEEIEKINRKFRNISDIVGSEAKLRGLEKAKAESEELRDKKIKEKKVYLMKIAPIIYSWNALVSAYGLIGKISESENLPSIDDIEIIKYTLKKGKCIVCGHTISEETRIRLSKNLEQLEKAGEFAKLKSRIERKYLSFVEEIKALQGKLQSLNEEIRVLDKSISMYANEINKITDILRRYDNDEIRRLAEILPKYQSQRDNAIKTIGALEDKIKGYQKQLNDLEEALMEQLKKEEELKKLSRYIEFTQKLLKRTKEAKLSLKEDIRQKLEEKTENEFFSLMWKKDFFEKVSLDEDFDVHVYNFLGMDVVGELSGGERKVLTIAFALALHDVAGSKSPLVIDRPLTNISGELPTKKVIEMLSQIANEKQIIVFLTPNEANDEMRKLLVKDASNILTVSNKDGTNATLTSTQEV